MTKLNTQIIKKQKDSVKYFNFTESFSTDFFRSKYLFHADL